MLTEKLVAEHLANALEHGERFSEPYDLTVFQPFSKELYSEILTQMPEDRYYDPLLHRDAIRPDGTSTRMVMSLDKKGTARLPSKQKKFWSKFNRVMRSKLVSDVFMRHLEPQLKARFKCPLSDIPRFPTARLGRDADGYKILPHPDSNSRVYTAQVYLADDDSRTDLGTSVYSRAVDGSFSVVRRLPYLPNTAFCFVCTDATWHGVMPISLKRPRNNLHMSCFQAKQTF